MPEDGGGKTQIAAYEMLIDGAWVGASDGASFESVNPATGAVWARIPEATQADVDRAVRAAHAAMTEGPWARMTPSARGRVLNRLADLLAEHSEELGRVETLDTGKLFQETRWQARYIAEFFRFYAGAADKLTGETLPIDKPDLFVFTRRDPVGVVAAVVPWNSQLFLSAVKIGPALAAGCAIVLKASEHAAAPLLAFGRLIEAAGIPPGVVNIVTGHGEPCGRALTTHPLVARIAFTGGPAAAAHVIRNSAQNFAEVSLELGGKSPILVFDDACLQSAVNGAVGGIFAASGQSCVAGSRLYLQSKIADAVLARLAEIAQSIRLGDPMAEATEMGPLCTEAQVATCEAQIARAVAQGAKLVAGGARQEGGGRFFQPTILDCPRQDLDIVDTELFGPVLCVLRFDDEAEALRLANDTRHGLAAGIFTRDGARQHRLAAQIRAGIVWINTYRVISPIAEFGGMQLSGYGRESGFQAVRDYTRAKTVWINTSDTPLDSQFVGR
ncbi:MAG: aldehyde dehydrogenase [Pikeienuella sp.]